MHILKLLLYGWLYLNAAWTTSALISLVLILWADHTVEGDPFICTCKLKITGRVPTCLEENPPKAPIWLIVTSVIFIIQYIGIQGIALVYRVSKHKKRCLVYQVKGKL